jgi:hypothetical protein
MKTASFGFDVGEDDSKTGEVVDRLRWLRSGRAASRDVLDRGGGWASDSRSLVTV